MKSRELQKRLNTTRTIHAKGNDICIASLYVNDLIRLGVDSGYAHCALGRTSDDELMGLVSSLEALTKDEREYYWAGADTIDDPITVYYIDDKGSVQTAITDSLVFPSVTADGVLMYENTHFESKQAALEYGLSNTKCAVTFLRENRAARYADFVEAKELLKNEIKKMSNLESQLGEVVFNNSYDAHINTAWHTAGGCNNE